MPFIDIDVFVEQVSQALDDEDCHINTFAVIYNPFTKIKSNPKLFKLDEILKLAKVRS